MRQFSDGSQGDRSAPHWERTWHGVQLCLPQPQLPVNQPVVDTVQRKAAFPTPVTNGWQKTLACVHCSQCVLHVCAVVIFGRWLGLEPRNEVLCYPANKIPRHAMLWCAMICVPCAGWLDVVSLVMASS